MRSWALAAMMILGAASVARAQATGLGLATPVNTFSISYLGHMDVVTDAVSSEIWALEDTGLAVAHHSATGPGDWTRVPSPTVRAPGPIPRFVSARLFPQTGIATFDPAPRPRGPGATRVYAVSVPNPALPALAEAQLWEYRTSTGTWRSLGHFPSVSFGSSPSISAGLIGGVRAWVAVRASNGHVLTCDYLDLNAPACNWTDLNDARNDPGGTHLAATSSDVALVDGVRGPHILTVRADGVAEMFEYATRRWTTLPAPSTEWIVTPGAIAAVSLRSGANREIRVVAGGHVPGGQSVDSLFVATTHDYVNWVWEEMLAPGDGPFAYATQVRNTLDIAARNIAASGPPVFDVAVYANARGGDGAQVFVPCLLPRRAGAVNGAQRDCVSDIADGALRTMPLPADLDPQLGFIGFPVAGVVLPRGRFGTSSFRGFTTGILANVGYVYQYDSTADGLDLPIWSNLLAPHTGTSLLGPTGAEFSTDEFYGQVAFTDFDANVWRSGDDGNSWSQQVAFTPSTGFEVVGDSGSSTARAGGDTNLGYDSMGNLYVTDLAGALTLTADAEGHRRDFIIVRRVAVAAPLSFDSSAPARVIPASVFLDPNDNNFPDRPWLGVLRDRPNFVIISWESEQIGRLAYCNAGAAGDCAAADAPWCPTTRATRVGPTPPGQQGPFEFDSSCGGTGCPIAQAPDGSVWVAVGPDNACPSARPGEVSVGFRTITNLDQLGPSCVPPSFSDPECVYFAAFGDGVPNQDVPQIPWKVRWPTTFTVARDTGDLLFGTTSLRNPAGLPCQPSDIHCRYDILFLRREAATGRWCGPAGPCITPSLIGDRPSIFADASSYANSDPPSQQADHVIPVGAFYDYGQASMYWMDFRVSPLIDGSTSVHSHSLFDYRQIVTRYLPDGVAQRCAVLGACETPGWPASLGLPLITTVPPGYADINQMASARLHGHSAHAQPLGTSDRIARSVLSSPRTPP